MNKSPSDQDDPYDERLSELMKLAETGDVLAARDVVEALALIVSSTHTMPDWNSEDPTRRVPVPVPDFVRDYLSRALLKIASGTDARDAFHLRKEGRQQFWAHHDKALAVDIMERLVDQGLAVDDAALDAAELINEKARQFTAQNPHSLWKKFSERPIENHTLLKWYYEHSLDPPPK